MIQINDSDWDKIIAALRAAKNYHSVTKVKVSERYVKLIESQLVNALNDLPEQIANKLC